MQRRAGDRQRVEYGIREALAARTVHVLGQRGAHLRRVEYALPDGVSSSAGIDFDDSTGTLWVAATSGTITCLTGLFCSPI